MYVYIYSLHPGNPLHPSSSSDTTPTPWCILYLDSWYQIYICIYTFPASWESFTSFFILGHYPYTLVHPVFN